MRKIGKKRASQIYYCLAYLLAVKQANPDSVEYLDARMTNLPRELINRTERHENYDDLAEEILQLCQLQEQTRLWTTQQKQSIRAVSRNYRHLSNYSRNIWFLNLSRA